MAFGVQIDIGGSTYYLTDGPPVGNYSPLLAPVTYSETLSLFGKTPALHSVSLEFTGVPMAQLRSFGHRLAGVPGRLYLLDDDGVETLLFSGNLTEPHYGGVKEPVFSSLQEGAYTDWGSVPGLTQAVSEDAFGSAYDDTRDGDYYPAVFGSPGFAITPQRAVPALTALTGSAYPIDDRVVVAANGVDASTVYLYNDTTGAAGTFSTFARIDALGNTYTHAVITAAGWVSAGDEIWASWSSDNAGKSSLYEATNFLLRQSTLTVDYAAIQELKGFAGISIDAYINKPTSPWGWFVQNILPYFPISPLSGPSGLSFVVHDFAGVPVRDLVEDGAAVSRLTQIATGPDTDVINSVRVNYAPHYKSGYRGFVVAEDKSSVRAYQKKEAETSLNITHHRDTAIRVARFLLKRDAYPSEEVDYLVPRAYDLKLGDLVSITDSEVFLDGRKAWVVGRTLTAEGPVSVKLSLLPR